MRALLVPQQPCLGAVPAARRLSLPRVVRTAASKGFGAKQPAKKKAIEEGPAVPGQREERAKAVKFKGKQQRRSGQQSVPARQQAAQQAAFDVVQPGEEEGAKRGNLVDEIEFEQRLKALAAETEERRREEQRAREAAGGIMDSWKDPEDNIYANPPSLAKTLLPVDDNAANSEYQGSKFGPSQAGLAVAAVLLGAVFLLTSGGGDYVPSAPPPSSSQQQQQAGQLGGEQRAELEKQLAEAQERLAANAGDLESLEASAVLSFTLGQYSEAEAQLVKLAEARPTDAEVLRVLAESQAAQGKYAPSAASYRKAWEASGRGSLEILQGLSAALVADGKEAAAVAAVQEASAPGGSSGIGASELQLLAGKVFSQWRGHVPDAIAVYDALIEASPEDFRGYLAKGLLLKEQGREGDATRYFIQAKYYAKGANRPLVDAILDSRQ